MSHISIKRLAYFDGKTFLNYALTPIKHRAYLTTISCVGFGELILCSVQEKELENRLENQWLDIPPHAPHAPNLQTSQNLQISQNAQLYYGESSDIYARLYQHCAKKGIFKDNTDYFLSFMKLKSGTFRVFAIEVDSKTDDEIDEKKASCDIFVPCAFLPFACEQNPSGVFLIDSWLLLYENGELLYDSYCADAVALEEALGFLKAAYGKQTPQIRYLGGFIDEMISKQNLSNQTQSSATKSNLANPTQSKAHSSADFVLSLARFEKLKSSDDKCNFCDDLRDFTKEKLCFDFVLKSQNDFGINADFGATQGAQANAPHKPKPIYNTAKKHFLQTRSFWASLQSLACCALVLALPFCKLGYAKYVESNANKLKEQNALAYQALQKSSPKNAPQKIEYLDFALSALSEIRKPYMPRLELIANISAIASKNAVWIGNLAIKSNVLEQDLAKDFGQDFAQNQADTTLNLGIYANDKTHIKNFLKELQNSAYFTSVDYAQEYMENYAENAENFGIDFSNFIAQKDDVFTAKISARLATKRI